MKPVGNWFRARSVRLRDEEYDRSKRKSGNKHNFDLLKAIHIVYTQLDPETVGIANFGNEDDDEGNPDPQITSPARDMGINVEQVIREEVGVDRGVTVRNSSDDQHTSDGNSGGKDDGDEGGGWDFGAGGWDAGATSWDVRARGWDAGATGWNASAAGWDAHASNFDQNHGRQH
ncbi:hypothetical protein Dsin_012480 [Dipteronia sinensis]|uniref:Uncharacterized protein n=1 Tax=Dipteronia sinensis TaxID=43782 RepID=A0AAE0AIU6_9ROSI|nr:hypothetical protein Dsin_012480 [Dipteronia sinensis]